MKRSYEIEHVVMTADAIGGVWNYALDLARGLAEYGVRTTMATMGPAPTALQRRDAANIPGLELHTSEYRLEWMPGAWKDVDDAGGWLLALAERVQPDVVHLNGYAQAALPWKVPILVAAHGDALSYGRSVGSSSSVTDEHEEYRRRVSKGLSCASMVVARSNAALQELAEEYGTMPESRTIPCGNNTATEAETRLKPIVLSATRCWDESKNLAALQHASGKTEWPIYVAGDLPRERQPRTQGVNFLGRLSPTALRSWYSQASIFAYPVRYDPFGDSVHEAASAGCALVLSDVPNLREHWDGAALFAPVNDSAAFADALRSLEENTTKRSDLAAAAVERARQFSATSMVSGYLFAYQDLKQMYGLDALLVGHPGVSVL